MQYISRSNAHKEVAQTSKVLKLKKPPTHKPKTNKQMKKLQVQNIHGEVKEKGEYCQ